MIDLKRACEIATEYEHNPYIDIIIDIGYGFVISTLSNNGEKLDVSPLIINKKSGDVERFFPPDYYNVLKKGKRVETPLVYKYEIN